MQINIEELKFMYQELLANNKITEANENVQNIIQLEQFMIFNLQKHLNKLNKGMFFETDDFLNKIPIDKIIKNFFNILIDKYKLFLIDEIVILKHINNTYIPAYSYSLNINKFDTYHNQSIEKIEKYLNELLEDLKFFLNKHDELNQIENGEGRLVEHQSGGSFDAIIRYQDYIIGFNNSVESLDSLRVKIGITKEEVVKEISQLYFEIQKNAK